MSEIKLLNGDCLEVLKTLPDESIDCCVTSPPYFGLRDYGVDGQVGLEQTPDEYIQKLVEVFREVRRVLKSTGTLWLNIGDCYATGTTAARKQSKNPGVGANNQNAQNSVSRIGTPEGCKTKDLIGIPWMLAFALRNDGWYLRQDIIWAKGNAMPESVKDRCTKSHEHIFLLSKKSSYFFDNQAIKEPCSEENVKDFLRRKQKDKYMCEGGYREVRPDLNRTRSAYMPTDFMRNKRDVWHINTKPFKGAHFATFPEKLVEPCILAGCPENGIVLDPFMGSGTTGAVAKKHGRDFCGIELNPEYLAIAANRIENAKQE